MLLQNLWWAAGYTLVAIPLAAGVLTARCILLTPAVVAVLTSASTVIAAIDAQPLKRLQLRRCPHAAQLTVKLPPI